MVRCKTAYQQAHMERESLEMHIQHTQKHKTTPIQTSAKFYEHYRNTHPPAICSTELGRTREDTNAASLTVQSFSSFSQDGS
jgi:hypothetical protein